LVYVVSDEFKQRGYVEFPDTDALTTTEPNILLATFTADCLPALIADAATPRIAVVHAGWRGTLSRILAKTILRLRELGSNPAELSVWLGPAISQANYETSPELADRFRAEFPQCPEAIDGRLLDLARLNAHQAQEAGVDASRIHAAGVCTFADGAHCESYRRDGADSGRMATVMMLKAAANV
jgi:YfiH family protein